ncbi:hypothetical protein D3P07_02095 [Paenibacillus sp. 1011MAR3C5]|uniref:hypothetical protein n=1 Tax=Paenibacillus sp. 1011MAR3C5 TaxID=1675787 RepID=UPI000E6C7FE4|nr:hypothetical protein [Paenibacillus sp. 1011MAR3C5]RJE90900.1 hypothetical protein D3P07_02095 [Paenibacillus sp. 1011MAR3C5]
MNQIEEIVTSFIRGSTVTAGVVSLLFMLFRSQPITLFTATSAEKIFFSKEKKLSILTIRYLFQVFIVSISMFSVFVHSYDNNISYYKVILWVMIIYLIIGFMFFIWKLIGYKSFKNYIKSIGFKTKLTILLSALLYCCVLIILPAFYLGNTVDQQTFDFELTSDNFFVEIIVVYVSFLLFSCVVLFYVKLIFKLCIEYDLFSDKSIYILLNENGVEEKWFVFYPVDKDTFLLGNEPHHDESLEFRYIERADLLKYKMNVFKREDAT